MLTINSQQSLFTAMKDGATVITPNNRLSNQLLNDFFALTHSTCDKPRCMPYSTFLSDSFKKARHLYAKQNHPLLLNAQQQRYLWQQILSQQQTECNDGLLNEVQEAWTRCQHWQIDILHQSFAQTPQTRLFQRWSQQFQQSLDELHALTQDQLVNHLLTYPNLFNETRVIWVCFDDYTPAQRTLQQAMQTQGCAQYSYDLAHRAHHGQQYAAKDCQDEQMQMIQWLKQKLADGVSRIAVVIPDLQTQSQHLQRILQRHIPPHQFDISLGQPLLDYPLVAHALDWLCLDQKTLSNQQVRLLLHSPYLHGSCAELIARAEVMQESKMLQEHRLPTATLIQALNPTAPILAELLRHLSAYPNEASPAAWINHFKARLTDLGFPGEYPLSSLSYQCLQRFIMLMDEFLQLSVMSPLMTQKQALNGLRALAKSTIFQAQKATTPIQILGLLEASGCTYDCIWVSGLTDQCLPQKTHLSAFIPVDLQREQQMPHAVAQRELQFAEQLLQRLHNGCDEIVFSYPRLIGDSPNLPSPLLSHLPAFSAEALPIEPHASNLVQYEELYHLPLADKERVSGGTAVLANQAKCPFRAFATHRLYAKSAPAISDGPDVSERGQIIHKIMDCIWKRLGSQRELLELTPEALHQLIDSAIKDALAPIITARSHSFSKLVQDVEHVRLHRLVNACLDWDKQRPSFTVEATEQEFTLALAGIDFRVRVDRLDKVAEDKKWVIDYKSSLPMSKPWNEERPEAPQLLLYALLDDNINALLFLQMKAGRITCSGLSETTSEIQGLSALKKDESWSNLQQKWHQQLTQLAEEFQTGHCPPQPSRSSTCGQCDFPNLCRKDIM